MGPDDPNCYLDACPLMGKHMPSVYCSSKRNKDYDVTKMLSGYCHSMVHQSNNLQGTTCGENICLTTDIMYISVFPGFWE